MSRPYDHDWKRKAREARIALEGVPEGNRELALRGLAGSISVNTLRKSLATFDFLQRWTIEKPAGAVALEEAPQSIVEAIARWSTFDEGEALEAALRWKADKTPVQELNRRMREARSAGGTDPGKTLAIRYRRSLSNTVEELVASVIGGRPERVDVNVRRGDDPTVDFRLRMISNSDPNHVRYIACVVVGPYRNPDLYRKRRHDWISRALALAWVHDAVVMVLPDGIHLPAYRESLEKFSLRAAKIGTAKGSAWRAPVVHAVSPLAPEDDAALARLAKLP